MMHGEVSSKEWWFLFLRRNTMDLISISFSILGSSSRFSLHFLKTGSYKSFCIYLFTTVMKIKLSPCLFLFLLFIIFFLQFFQVQDSLLGCGFYQYIRQSTRGSCSPCPINRILRWSNGPIFKWLVLYNESKWVVPHLHFCDMPKKSL